MVKRIVCHLLLLLITGGFGSAFSQGLVDPMRPAPYQAPQISVAEQERAQVLSELQLTAILTGSKRSVAVINGEVLQVGQKILGYRLTDITTDQVVLKKGAQRLVLSDRAQVVKTPSAREE